MADTEYQIVETTAGEVREGDAMWDDGYGFTAVGKLEVAEHVEDFCEISDTQGDELFIGSPGYKVLVRRPAPQSDAGEERPSTDKSVQLDAVEAGEEREAEEGGSLLAPDDAQAMREAITRTLSAWDSTTYVPTAGGIDSREAWRIMFDALGPYRIHNVAQDADPAAIPPHAERPDEGVSLVPDEDAESGPPSLNENPSTHPEV